MTFKKRILALASAMMLVPVIAVSAMSASADTIVYGDVDGNGTVDINDATKVQKKILDMPVEVVENFDTVADVNLDKKVNVRDVTLIQMKVAALINELPVTETEAETQPETDEEGWYHKIIQP